MAKLRLPRLVYNWISGAGAALASVMAVTGLVLLIVSFGFESESNPYFGIFLYMVIPTILVAGLLLIPIGMFIEWRRWKKHGEQELPSWPRIDFNRSSHRNAAIIFIVGTIIFAALSSVGSYRAYHYSESVEFCGTTCHQVMSPEYTTYQHSPHARVKCAECHIGEGADWFVKSKLSGAYQIYAVIANVYPRPIPTPIENLRPAEETCEKCHWPQKKYGATQRTFHHTKYDEENTHWPIEMLLRTDEVATGLKEGPVIHWHINAEVEYVATDEQRMEIPWVRVTDPETGLVTVYEDENNPISEEELAQEEIRTMDCMDCHNRPSHNYESPDGAVDQMFLEGLLDRGLPSIKRIAVNAISEEYESEEAAMEGIEEYVLAAYREEYPDLVESDFEAVQQGIQGTQEAYRRNIFPYMKANWSVYPEHIGHFETPGCMRCHNGSHVSEAGEIIKNGCNVCHVIIAQGPGQGVEIASLEEGARFRHPEDIGEMWTEIGCWECHTGTQP
ncbi:MAG: NapC/NirT family cytochrome c [Thermoanaerobaculia bacterium]|nr:NapC/NirT family cytochrome c [Thermoanaerobaculia bacterium]